MIQGKFVHSQVDLRNIQFTGSHGSTDMFSHTEKTDMSVQTKIKGVEQQLLFWPDHLNTEFIWDEYARGQISARSDETSSDEDSGAADQSESDIGLSSYKLPNIIWSKTPIYKHFYTYRKNPHRLNTSKDIYSEEEIDYTLSLIKQRYQEFDEKQVSKPYYNKALHTLEYLLAEQTLEMLYDRLA